MGDSAGVRAVQPSGTVTLVFTDIEGSTRLLAELGEEAYLAVLSRHREVLRKAFGRHGGYEVDYEGDSFFYAFQSAQEAMLAVHEAIAGLADGPIRVRVGAHTGEPGLDPPNYVGMDVHRAARIMAAGHGGQVLVSAATAALVGTDELRDLGEHRLKDLGAPERLFQLGEGDFPPLRSLHRTNLPVPSTPFLGRERELAAVVDRVRNARLLTLTGPGGTGKTRLALQAAAEVADDFPDGVFWVPLAPLHDPQLVLSAIAQALEVKEQPGQELTDTLAVRLEGKHVLVLLDNAEHLLPDLASLLRLLRDAAPAMSLLVTSRERLRLAGEQVYAVPSLSEPEAVALFLSRAAALGSTLEPSDAVRQLCLRLDNLPLALELAAARSVVFSPEQLLERLGQRLDLLKGERDADPRQSTLRATIDWSYQLLDPGEQRVFRALSVFAGGCTYEAAEEVAGADPDTLQSLLDKNLLRRRDTDLGPRYWQLETIREYASEKLQGAGGDSLLHLHCRYFADLAEQADPRVRDGDAVWLARLEADHLNLRAALDRALSTENESSLDLVGALAYFWWLHGHIAEGRRWLEAALSADSGALTAKRGRALNGAAALAVHAGDLTSGREYSEQSLVIWETLDDWDGRVRALNELGKIAAAEGQFERAEQLYEDAAELARDRDPVWVLVITINRAEAAFDQGENDLARALFRQIVDTARHLGFPLGLLDGLIGSSRAAFASGHVREARELLAEAIPLAIELDFKARLFEILVLAARLLGDADPEVAVRVLGAADGMRVEGGFVTTTESHVDDSVFSAVQASLGDRRAFHAFERGRALQPEEAATYALEFL